MKQLMVLNIHEDGKRHFSLDRVILSLKAQLENSFDLGWKKEDIIVVSNKDLSMFNVIRYKVELNDHCFTGSKLFGIKYVFDNKLDYNDIVWCHDLDLWENYELCLPEIEDMAISTYSSPTKLNGGSVFWTNKAIDILNDILNEIKKEDRREEPTINKILNSGKYNGRHTILNQTYNVGCSGYVPRMLAAEKPIRCIHMTPYNKISWETHKLNRDGCNLVSVSPRLEKILRKYFPLANELSEKGKIRQKELKKDHRNKMKRYKGNEKMILDEESSDNGNYSLNNKFADKKELSAYPGECCINCIYGGLEYTTKDSSDVLCKRFPNVISKKKIDWCGEFKLKK